MKYNAAGETAVSSLPQSTWFSLEEYLALERASDRRFEYRNGEIVCMSGGTREHAAICRNIVSRIFNKLGRECQVYGSDLAVFVPEGRPYRYPDATIVCGGPRLRVVDGRDCLENPVLLVEVMSPTSTDFDRGTKFEEYKSIPTFAEYLLVSQEKPHVTRRHKQPDASWLERVVDSMDAVIRLDSLGIDLAVHEVYQDVRFQP